MLITAIHIVSLKSFHTVKPFNMPTTPIPYIVDPSGQPPTRPYSHSFKDAHDLVVDGVAGVGAVDGDQRDAVPGFVGGGGHEEVFLWVD